MIRPFGAYSEVHKHGVRHADFGAIINKFDEIITAINHLFWLAQPHGRDIYTGNSSEISKCKCGGIPQLVWCDDDSFHNSRQFAYFCECGKAGVPADSPPAALEQ